MSTHQQLLYHIVFSTKGRRALMQNEKLRSEAFAYLAGTARKLEGFPIIVGGYVDHVHLLVRVPAKVSVSSFVGQLKANTSKYFNQGSRTFQWQDGFGALNMTNPWVGTPGRGYVGPPGLATIGSRHAGSCCQQEQG